MANGVTEKAVFRLLCVFFSFSSVIYARRSVCMFFPWPRRASFPPQLASVGLNVVFDDGTLENARDFEAFCAVPTEHHFLSKRVRLLKAYK